MSGLVLVPTPAVAEPTPAALGLTITLRMDWFERFEVPDDGINEEGEFYPEVKIGDGPVRVAGTISDDAFHPATLSPSPWVFTEQVNLPEGRTTLDITVSIKDLDDTFGFGDDRMDISPQNQDVDLNLTYNVLTDTWSGDGIGHGSGLDNPCSDRDGKPQGQACAVGDGDPNFPEDGDGKRAALGLTITSSGHSDADQDGIADRDERFGVRNEDGSMAVDLPAFGADPLHKDLFLELDHTDGVEPSHEAIEVVKRAFAAAPLPNPSGGDGITLHVDSGGLHDKNAMEGPPQGTCGDGLDNDGKNGQDGADPDCTFRDVGVENPTPNCDNGTDDDDDGKKDAEDPDCLAGENLGGGNTVPALGNCGFDAKFFQTKGAPGNNFATARQRVFNYVIYTTPDADTDGAGPDTGCGIGGQGSGTDIVLYRTDPAALMHELGHNLGLHHGGNETHNCKPNYVSVMNYDINSGIPRAGGGLLVDFSPARITLDGKSRGKAPMDRLKEDDLYENRVLDPGDNVNNFVFMDDKGVKRTTPLNANPDWNGDNPSGFGDDGDQRFEVNIDAAGPADCKNDTKNSELNGHNDWKAVQAYLPHRFPVPGGPTPPIETETFPTREEAERILRVNNTTDLAVAIADSPDPAAAGESLNWTITVSNNGPNSATSTQVTTTLPADVTNPITSVPCGIAGKVVTCNLNELRQGASKQYTIKADVPADVVYRNGAPKTITARSTVDNLAGPDSHTGNDTATAETKVIAKADVKVTEATATSPLEVLIGQPGSASLEVTLGNAGPSSPIDTTLTTSATADSGVTVTPATATFEQTALTVGSPQKATYTANLECTTPGVKTVKLNATLALKKAEDVDPDMTNNEKSVSFQIDCVVPIAINVRPGGSPNSINLNTDATLAALTTKAGEYDLPLDFDAAKIDASTALWGLRDKLFNTATPTGAREVHGRGHRERSYELDEKTRDADTDLVLHFKPSGSGLTLTSTRACLKGKYLAPDAGVYTFLGCDTVRVVN
ncbi:hypothetical protein Pth03_74970 [Planotetraspora thailandica]|uniref:DUF11 domain-containing protein n=2 Tax=Planotetraspora thailandica TaxID=487172 RepID=A0A8J3Y1F6_9ACTN|nr:hypothetical protein Pth03_74970 [Planotetraspora thailandica]